MMKDKKNFGITSVKIHFKLKTCSFGQISEEFEISL